MQNPVPVALRVAVVGGGCSGFQYHMAFENQTNETDEVADFGGLKVAVMPDSLASCRHENSKPVGPTPYGQLD